METIPDCIIPAAGFSSRMGEWKIAMPWGNHTVIESVAEASLAAGCRTIIAGGYRIDELRKIFASRSDVMIAEIRDWEAGMGATIRGALELIESESVFLVPGDMPLVKSSDFLRLAAEGNGICSRPLYQGIPGHPVLLGPKGIKTVMESAKDEPLYKSLQKAVLKPIPWDHSGVVKDVDTKKDYDDAKKFLDLR